MRSLRLLAPYFRIHRKKLLFGLVIVTISNIFTVSVPAFARQAFDLLARGNADIGDVVVKGLFMLGGTAFAGFFMFLTRQTIIVMSREIENDMRNDFLAKLQGLPLGYFHTTSTGDIMAYATNDIASVRNFVGPSIMYTADTVTTFIFVLGMMLATNTRLALWALVPLPFVSFGVYLIGRRVYPLFTAVQQQFGTVTSRAQESISGVRVVRAYVREAFEEAQMKMLGWDYLQKNMRLARVQGWMQPLMFMLVGMSHVIVLAVGASELAAGRLTIGGILQFIMYLSILIWPMIAFGWVSNMIQRAAASMARINAVMEIAPAFGVGQEGALREIEGRVTFENVAFTFPARTRPALDGVSFDIPAGATVGIIGTTGSGKSTMVALLPRLLNPTSGVIKIDGVPIESISPVSLRRSIATVTQDPFLFSDTVRDNIKFAMPDATDEQVEQAAKNAQLYEDVTGFPKGFETMIGERGITLSGGQKQRTAIARALLCEPRILVLDDALSAVDTHTEEAILRALRDFRKGRTAILIAHRISTVKDCDQILVMDEGKITERGTHEQLLELKGEYAAIYEQQALEEELEKF
jgi:ATP-binding cassette subfamily B multidrug efflux pump